MNTAVGTSEATCDDLVLKSEGFEDLGTLVTCQGADAHLGHDFQHTLGNCLSVASDNLAIVQAFEQSIAAGLPQRFERKIGIDCIGTVTDEQAMMMHFTGFTGLKHNSDPCSLGGTD